MLVVDPMRRITIPEIRQHPWFLHKLPQYLSLHPQMIEVQHRFIDDEIVEKVCLLEIPDVNAGNCYLFTFRVIDHVSKLLFVKLS